MKKWLKKLGFDMEEEIIMEEDTREGKYIYTQKGKKIVKGGENNGRSCCCIVLRCG